MPWGRFFCLSIRWNFRRHYFDRRGLCGTANHFGDGFWRTASADRLGAEHDRHVNGDKRIEGPTTCGVGLLIGSIGAAPATGEFRMTFDPDILATVFRL